MKNRTVIGILCIVMAVIMTFAVAPLVNRISTDEVTVPRLCKDIKQGTKISKEDIIPVKINKNALPKGTITESKKIVGKYAASDLYDGDLIWKKKLSEDGTTAEDVFAHLDGSKVAISVTVDSIAAGLSGKFENGDIITLFVVDKDKNDVSEPPELKYMKVITATTSGGVDKDKIIKNDDGTFELPSTVTVLANTEQAKLLAKYESKSTMHTALVYRGKQETANKFLAVQDEYFKNKEAGK